MASYYDKLKRDLDLSAAEGLITAAQASAVYERSLANRLLAQWKAVHWIALFSGILIAAGVSLVLAHNWDKFGAVVKISGFLLVFAAAAEAAMRLEDRPAAAVPAEALWFFMPVIGIGLYAQIFHLSGDPMKPYLVWAALSLPLALLAHGRRSAFLLVILLFGTLFAGTLTPGSMLSLVSRYGAEALPPWWHWPLALSVLGTASAVGLYRRCHSASRLLGAALAWVVMLLLADTVLKVRSEAFVLLAVSSATALWVAWTPAEERGEARLPYLAWFANVYAMTFLWHHSPRHQGGADSPWGVVLVWALFAFALGSVALKPLLKDAGKGWEAAFKAALIAPPLAAFLLFGATEVHAKAIALFANLIICAAGAGLIWNGAMENSERRINYGIAAVSLIAVTRFVDLFGGLLNSGLGFIGAGLGFAALATFINRGRKALIQSAEEAKR
ncbi:MAG: DUF2157 domain-containing protein [Elusimicrobia bacterium]|nr:DUF2157 domain-containing protein [Elusimicrobiota bacterium]